MRFWYILQVSYKLKFYESLCIYVVNRKTYRNRYMVNVLNFLTLCLSVLKQNTGYYGRNSHKAREERGGSVVECLTQDPGVKV